MTQTAGLTAADRLLHQRIIVLGQQVDDDIANKICAELLLLSAEDPARDISLYINSPGGSVSAGLAIYDTMQLVPNDVSTLAMGMAASMGPSSRISERPSTLTIKASAPNWRSCCDIR